MSIFVMSISDLFSLEFAPTPKNVTLQCKAILIKQACDQKKAFVVWYIKNIIFLYGNVGDNNLYGH